MKISNRKKKNNSTLQLVGAEFIAQNCVRTTRGECVVYVLVEPVNLAVLSSASITAKVNTLMNTLKSQSEVGLLCLGSREDFDSNKLFIKERLEAETNEAVRALLEKDLLFLDQVQIQTASAREFAFALRFHNEDDIAPAVSRLERLLKDEGIRARVAERDDLKRLYAVYFQSITQLVLDDYDGERWVAD